MELRPIRTDSDRTPPVDRICVPWLPWEEPLWIRCGAWCAYLDKAPFDESSI